jgi:hypothetical protein
MKSTHGALVAALALAALAGAAQAAQKEMDCGRIDWYRLGERDAETNSNRLARYAVRCAPGSQVDPARYSEGQVRGRWVRQMDHWQYTPPA